VSVESSAGLPLHPGAGGASQHSAASSALNFSSVASCGEDRSSEALHKRLGTRLGLDGPTLHLVDLDELLLDPRVPKMEWYPLLLTLGVELSGRDSEDEVRVVLVVNNFERQTTLHTTHSKSSKARQ